MTRTRCVILFVLGSAALAAMPLPAEARTVEAGLPAAGDITVMHVVFKRSAASARALPDFQLAPGSTRELLQRYRVAVIGASFRLSRKQVVGSVLLMRKRGRGRVTRTPRGALARVATAAPVASVTVERNAIADLRRARASGEQANGPTACGETGLFSLLSGDPLPRGGWSFGLYYNNWDAMIDYSDEAIERRRSAEAFKDLANAYWVACEDRLIFQGPDKESYENFINGIGAKPPGVGCAILVTYIGSATDGEGHVLTEPSVSFSVSCPVTINGISIRLPDHMPLSCGDSAGHECSIHGDVALFPFSVPPFENRTFGVTADPPLERGDQIDLLIETPRGDQTEHQVM